MWLKPCLMALLTMTTTATLASTDLAAPDASAKVQAGQVTLIDIRTPGEWKETGVPKGAKLVNMVHPQGATGFVNAVLDKVNGDRAAPIALICRTGNRTTQVQRYLESQGFTNIHNVKEGMAGSSAGPGWIKRGLPVETCSNQC